MPHIASPRSAAVRAPDPMAGHCWSMPLQETLKHSRQVLLSFFWRLLLFSLGPGMHNFCLCPWVSLMVGDFILNAIAFLLPSFWCFFCACEHRVSFFGEIQHSPVYGCSAASCDFGVFTGEDEYTSFTDFRLKSASEVSILPLLIMQMWPKDISNMWTVYLMWDSIPRKASSCYRGSKSWWNWQTWLFISEAFRERTWSKA